LYDGIFIHLDEEIIDFFNSMIISKGHHTIFGEFEEFKEKRSEYIA
jgi:hypothetical protein